MIIRVERPAAVSFSWDRCELDCFVMTDSVGLNRIVTA